MWTLTRNVIDRHSYCKRGPIHTSILECQHSLLLCIFFLSSADTHTQSAHTHTLRNCIGSSSVSGSYSSAVLWQERAGFVFITNGPHMASDQIVARSRGSTALEALAGSRGDPRMRAKHSNHNGLSTAAVTAGLTAFAAGQMRTLFAQQTDIIFKAASIYADLI